MYGIESIADRFFQQKTKTLYDSQCRNTTHQRFKWWNNKWTHMSDLRPNCFCGRMTCTDWESLVFGIGWLMMAIALATLPTFLTCWSTTKPWSLDVYRKKQYQHEHNSYSYITLFGKYDGSHTTFLHFAVSPSDVTPITCPTSLNSTCRYRDVGYRLLNEDRPKKKKTSTLHSGLFNM